MLAVIVVQASPTIVPRGECRGIPPPKTYHNISLHERFYLNHILLIFLAYLHHVLCPPGYAQGDAVERYYHAVL